MYTFLFDRKSLVLLVTGAAAAGVLLFVLGVLVGLQLDLAESSPEIAEFRPLSAFEGGLVPSAGADSAPAPAATSPPSDELAAPAPQSEPSQPEPSTASAEPAVMKKNQEEPGTGSALAPSTARVAQAPARGSRRVPRVVLPDPPAPRAPEPTEAQAAIHAVPTELTVIDETTADTVPEDAAPEGGEAGATEARVTTLAGLFEIEATDNAVLDVEPANSAPADEETGPTEARVTTLAGPFEIVATNETVFDVEEPADSAPAGEAARPSEARVATLAGPFEIVATHDTELEVEPADSAPTAEGAGAAEARVATAEEPIEIAAVDETVVDLEPGVQEAAREETRPGAAPPAGERAARTGRRGYSVQVGAYGVPANAQQRLSRVLAAGLDGFIAPMLTAAGGELRTVRFGDYPTVDAAVAAAESYRARYGRDALVRPPA